MDHDTHPGAKALLRWREGAGLTQAGLADRIVPPVTQGAVARWEDATAQRPALSTAVQIQRLSHGEVDATLWGYPAAEVNAVMGVVAEPAVDPRPSPVA
ncbi:MAG: helix-turn-helix transcriptional regulator [Deltaproteobacteria bacterium]|nr:helix-turn-helix transcriptional regulator [Myxococcales bacterium]MDP3220953.1 helix-turn-helix transcriptional regulator [Deltaproteobacteria bacterium]